MNFIEANNEPGMEGMDEMSCNDDNNSNDNDPHIGGMGKVDMGGYQSKHLKYPKTNNNVNNNYANDPRWVRCIWVEVVEASWPDFNTESRPALVSNP